MTKLILLGLLLGGYLILVACGKAGPFRWEQHTLEPGKTVTVPKGWIQRDSMDGANWKAYGFYKAQSWWIGAGEDPQEVRAWVAIGGPQASVRDMEDAMNQIFKGVQDNSRRFDEFGSYPNGSRETWISEGNYQIKPSHDPEKVIFLRAIDRDKKIAIAIRVYTRKIPHEQLKRITQRLWDSLGSGAAKNSF